jgi:hypothetical protein
MSILFRKSKRFGTSRFHVRLNMSKAGASWTLKVGPWSWNTRSRRHRVDLPGPFAWQQSKKR